MNNFADLSGKVAIVTGASRGIGKEIALKLAHNGATIVINDIGPSEQTAKELVKEIEDLGGQALAVLGDVSVYEDTENLVKATLEKFGRVDILVNNAGITRDNLAMRMKEDDFDKVISVNLKGVWNCCKQVIRPMSKQRSGKIINISSVVGLIGNAGQTNYASAKAGVIGLTKSLARELAPRNVNVNAIAPGFIETEMTAKLSSEIIENYEKNIPLRKLGKPEDIANAVVFLASDKSSYISGQTLSVNGGLVMY